jgi:tryptophanyl-tRNA synthetase
MSVSPQTLAPSVSAAQARSAALERVVLEDPVRFRVLTGDRPTGRLHLGHYFASLRNRIRLQRLGAEVFVLVADFQALTDPALNQLLLPFLSLVSVPELSRNPTVKDEIAHSRQSSVSGLMFTYPVHQAADILFCKADLVPVGQDQLPHLEITRTVARRFNERYGQGGAVFPEPEALLSEAPLLLGTDGTKMSKSRGNAISLAADADETARLIRRARTDTERRITYDPAGRPEVSSLVLLAALCLDRDPHLLAEEIGTGGAGALKRVVIEAVNEHLAPLRARRAALAQDRPELRRVLRRGNERANAVAEQTLEEVRTAMRCRY